jgi:hypothetical protein
VCSNQKTILERAAAAVGDEDEGGDCDGGGASFGQDRSD